MAHADLSGRNKFWGNCHARPAPSTKNILGKFMTNDKRNIIMDRIIINQWSVISIQWTYEGWSIRASKKKSFIFVWLIALNQLKSHICFLYEYRKTAETVWSTQHKCCILAMKYWCNDTPNRPVQNTYSTDEHKVHVQFNCRVCDATRCSIYLLCIRHMCMVYVHIMFLQPYDIAMKTASGLLN